MAGLAEEGERAQGLSQSRRRRRRDAGAGKVKVDGEYRHAERAERHRARRNLALQQAVAADRPDADADREHREEESHHRLVATQHGLGIGRKQQDEGGADQPEPRDAEDREEDVTAGRGMLQRSEEHKSELQSLMRITYAVF